MPPEKIPAPQQPAPPTTMPEQGKEVKSPPPFELKTEDKPKVDAGEKQKPAKPKTRKEIDSEDNIREDRGTYIYVREKGVIMTIPKGASGTLPTAVIYGGLTDRGGEKQEVFDQTPTSYFSSKIMVFANWFTGYGTGVKPAVQAIAKREGVTAEFKALLGFSKGGEIIRKVQSEEAWKVIGLIDPSVFGWEEYTAPAYMVWSQWDSKLPIKDDPRYKLDKRIKAGKVKGGSKHKPDVGHKQMPAAWFSEWGSRL
jgi:hypothetical protein